MNKMLSSLLVVVVASVTALSANAQEIKGDAMAGAGKITMCIGCHGIKGYQSSFPEVYKVPMISGQGAKYIASALVAYQKGERRHPTMRGVADGLSEQDIADISAYYEADSVKNGAGSATAAPASDKAAELAAKGGCVACHGDNFNKPIDPSYPKIAGQHADYLFVALKSYKAEGHATWGRSNGVMGGIAKLFTNAELKVLADFVHSLPGELQTVPQARFK